VVDELSGESFEWYGANPYVRLYPPGRVAHIFDLTPPGGPDRRQW
jgi:hypothetical protein